MDSRFVTCKTTKYSVKCLSTSQFMSIKEMAYQIAPYMPYDPCTLFIVEGKPLYIDDAEKYAMALIVGSEFYEIESGLIENAATVIDGETTCVLRIWSYYDADGEYYISKAIFMGCHGHCTICQNKCNAHAFESCCADNHCCGHCHDSVHESSCNDGNAIMHDECTECNKQINQG